MSRACGWGLMCNTQNVGLGKTQDPGKGLHPQRDKEPQKHRPLCRNSQPPSGAYTRMVSTNRAPGGRCHAAQGNERPISLAGIPQATGEPTLAAQRPRQNQQHVDSEP